MAMRSLAVVLLAIAIGAGAACGSSYSATNDPMSGDASDEERSTTSGEGGSDAGTTGDAPSDGAEAGYLDPGVRCGASKTGCDPRTSHVCCAPFHSDLQEAFSSLQDTCAPAAGCSGELAIECDSMLDCVNAGRPGTLCCVGYGKAGPYTGVAAIRCLSPADCMKVPTLDGGKPPAILCDRFAPAPCPSGTTCQADLIEAAFDVCR